MNQFLRIVLASAVLTAGLSVPASAAHLCSAAELDQILALFKASDAGERKCAAALSKKYAPGTVKKTCAACAADIRATKRVDQWMTQHPRCAKDLHMSRVDRTGHAWVKSYQRMCR